VAGVAALMSIDALDPSEGDRVLVVVATGGTGSYAVQRTFSLEEATSGLDAFQRESTCWGSSPSWWQRRPRSRYADSLTSQNAPSTLISSGIMRPHSDRCKVSYVHS
jgi:hypothetical protein